MEPSVLFFVNVAADRLIVVKDIPFLLENQVLLPESIMIVLSSSSLFSSSVFSNNLFHKPHTGPYSTWHRPRTLNMGAPN